MQPTATISSRLEGTAERFGALLRSVHRPGAKAIGHWTAAETAAHVATVSYFDAMVAGADVELPFAADDLLGLVAESKIEDIGRLNAESLRRFEERDPTTIAEHIEAGVGKIASAVEADADGPTSWLGGIRIPRRTVAAHLLGELLIHGLDIARSQGGDWDIDAADARSTFDVAYMPILEAGGHLMASPGLRAVSVAFDVPGSDPVAITVGPGSIAVAHASDARGDIVLRADATTMLLVMFERINPVWAVVSGRVRVGGRRPWRIRRMRAALSMP